MLADPPKQRVLIGESDWLCRTGLEQPLTRWGYAVESFTDGFGALERLLMPDAPGIALLDFDLPGKSCLEICQILRASNPTPSTQVCRVHSPWIIGILGTRGGALGGMGRDRRHAASRPPTQNPESPESEDWRFAGLAAHEVGWALQAGICDILPKPIEQSELRLRLHAAQYIQVLKDEAERSAEALGFGATHDPLTRLWNREAFLSLLFQETDRAQRTGSALALIAADVDHFTQCNLELGYKAGDQVLEQLAMRFRRHLRSYDILGRCGEDEFVVALPGCGPEDAAAMAERLRVEVMHAPFHIKTASLTIRASFGVAQSRGRSPLLVLREAEGALAAAKRAGRDRVRRYELKLLGDGGPARPHSEPWRRQIASARITNYPAAIIAETADPSTALPPQLRFGRDDKFI